MASAGADQEELILEPPVAVATAGAGAEPAVVPAEQMEGAPATPRRSTVSCHPVPCLPCPSRAPPSSVDKTAGGDGDADDEQALVGEYTWTIENFSKLKQLKLYSPVFQSGQYNWCAAPLHTSADARRSPRARGGRGAEGSGRQCPLCRAALTRSASPRAAERGARPWRRTLRALCRARGTPTARRSPPPRPRPCTPARSRRSPSTPGPYPHPARSPPAALAPSRRASHSLLRASFVAGGSSYSRAATTCSSYRSTSTSPTRSHCRRAGSARRTSASRSLTRRTRPRMLSRVCTPRPLPRET